VQGAAPRPPRALAGRAHPIAGDNYSSAPRVARLGCERGARLARAVACAGIFRVGGERIPVSEQRGGVQAKSASSASSRLASAGYPRARIARMFAAPTSDLVVPRERLEHVAPLLGRDDEL
jgi:hypothetical protein